MSFDVNTFATNPSKTALYNLTKTQLRQVVDKVGLECDTTAKKAELREALLDYFIEEDLISEEQLSTSDKLEIKRLELEHKAREQKLEQEGRLS